MILVSEELALNTLSCSGIKMVCFAVITCFAVVFYVLTIRAVFQVSHTFHLMYEL